jgi:hypothetical protein
MINSSLLWEKQAVTIEPENASESAGARYRKK